jgi:hypothetical protein
MCMPPSNRMKASATVTTRCTVLYDTVKRGNRSEAAAAKTRKNAGAGILSRSLSRLESTAAVPIRPMTSTTGPNDSISVTGGVLSSAG